jgi:hypothetical protein
MFKNKASKKSIPLILSFLVALTSLFTVVVSPMPASAAIQAIYYVSPTGSDSNLGTFAAPFKTITKARDVVRTINGNYDWRYLCLSERR